MKNIFRKIYVSFAVRIILIVFFALAILFFAFIEGMFYANKKTTLIMANDGAYMNFIALQTINDSNSKKFESQIDTNLDYYSYKLADYILKYPYRAERRHYNLLIHVKKYREKNGRHKENYIDKISTITATTVDDTINRAISKLEAIHDIKTWEKPNIDEIILEKGR